YILFRTFQKSHSGLVRIVPVALYAYNVYLFNTWENIKVTNLSLMAALPLALAVVNLFFKNRLSLIVCLVLLGGISLIGSGMGINPAYLAVYLSTLVAFGVYMALANHYQKRWVVAYAAMFVAAVLIINAYWILPLTFNLFGWGGTPLLSEIGQINAVDWIDGLSAHTSIFNLFRLLGAWDWYGESSPGVPYIPYAYNYFSNPVFIFFGILIPILGFSSLLFSRLRREIVFFNLLVLIGLFLSAGTHPPTGRFFKVLLDAVPFFSFFRSPWYIFTPIVLLGLAMSIGLLFDQLLYTAKGKFWQWRLIKLPQRIALSLLMLVFVIFNVLYCYPLVSGEVFRAGTPGSVLVNIPNYVLDTRDFLNSLPKDKRIISLPYTTSEHFNWEYKGIASILNLLAPVNVLTYNFASAKNDAIGILTDELYRAIHFGEVENIKKLAGPLNVEYLYNKNDTTDFDSSPLSHQVAQQIADAPLPASFGLWDFWKIKDQFVWPRIFVPSKTIFSAEDDVGLVKDLLSMTDGYQPKLIAKSKLDKLANGWIKAYRQDERISYLSPDFKNRGVFEYSNLEFNQNLAVFDVKVPRDGQYQLYVEKDQLGSYGLGSGKPWDIIIDKYTLLEKMYKLKVEKSDVRFLALEKFFLSEGGHTISINLPNNFNYFENYKFERIVLSTGELVGQSKEEFEKMPFAKVNLTVRLGVSLPDINSKSMYQISLFDPTQTALSRVVIVSQQIPERNVMYYQVSTKDYISWPYTRLVIRPLYYPSILNVAIDDNGNNMQFLSNPAKEIQVHRIFTNSVILKPVGDELTTSHDLPQNPQVKYEKLSPTKYLVSIDNVDRNTPLVLQDKFSPSWKVYRNDDNGYNLWATWGKKPILENNHQIANGYGNVWWLQTPGSYDLIIEYWPQRLFYLGFFISTLVFILGCLIVIRAILITKYGRQLD
ncbi:DUF3367 domain-containing protein, partial [Candidatus Daviesbacteria bacterium]|nr:DUF3367 domain-containing protein [Candidatus Daviesbacteria bacterium]